MPHKPNIRDTAALSYWRAIDSEMRALGELAVTFGEATTLFRCGYSIPQALRVLAPGRRAPLRLVSSR